MRYWVVGAIALALILHWVGWAPSEHPRVGMTITTPWWIVPAAPTFIFIALIIRRLLRRPHIKEKV